MDSVRFFDCSSMIGRRRIKDPSSFYETDELIRKMKYCGIESAMVYHSLASEYSPAVGNQMLMEEIKDFPFFMGVWVGFAPSHR